MTELRDWVGTWFELATERGETCEIPFGLLGSNGEVTWRTFPHASIDGIAAMAEVVGAPSLPLVPEAWREKPARPLPSPFLRKPSAKWKTLDVAKVGEPSGRAHRFLSVEDTTRLKERATAQGVSVNSLLGWALARAVESELDLGVGAILFELPVNLRGAPSLPPDLAADGNVFATVTIDLGAATPALVHAAMQTARTRGEHWSSWASLTIGREQGLEFVSGAAKNAAAATGYRVGVFSNMGVWSGSGPEAIVFCPPPAQRTPLAAGAVTWNGRLGLMLQTHANLASVGDRVGGWLEEWVEASLA